MKNEKIYFENNPDALFYYRQLEDNDKIDANCCIRHGDTWTPISKDNPMIGHTWREMEEALFFVKSTLDIVIAKKFDNEN